MGYTISNLGTDIKVTDGVDNSWLFPKDGTMVYHYGDKVRLTNGSVKIEINYTAVDSPSVASGAVLFNTIEDYKQAGNASTSSVQTEVAYNNASTQLVAENVDRKGVLIVNKTDAYITIEHGNVTVVLNEGAQVEVDKAHFVETTEEIKFICNTATSGKVIAIEYL
jgi:adenosine/AMP kinase